MKNEETTNKKLTVDFLLEGNKYRGYEDSIMRLVNCEEFQEAETVFMNEGKFSDILLPVVKYYGKKVFFQRYDSKNIQEIFYPYRDRSIWEWCYDLPFIDLILLEGTGFRNNHYPGRIFVGCKQYKNVFGMLHCIHSAKRDVSTIIGIVGEEDIEEDINGKYDGPIDRLLIMPDRSNIFNPGKHEYTKTELVESRRELCL